MSNEPTQNSEAQSPPAAPAESAPAPEAEKQSTDVPPTAASAGSLAGDGHEGDESAAEGEDGAAGEGTAEAQAGGPPAPGTGKKRRRRRKKKGGGANAAPSPEGAAPETGATAPAPGAHPEGDRPRKKERRPRPEGEMRERPAFGVGDVVFGKIIQMTDEVLFVDLSGKAKAIFDRRELLLPEEPAQGPGSELADDDEFPDPGDLVAADHEAAPAEEGEAHAESPAEAPAAGTAEEQAERARERRIIVAKTIEEEQASPPTQHSGDAPAPEAGEASAEGAAPPVAEAAAPEAAAPEAAAPEVAPAAAAPAHKRESVSLADAPVTVTLPPVVLEVGANFVGVVHNDGGRGGLVVLTRHPRRGRLMKLPVARALREKTTVLGLITGVIKGGIEVDIDGLRAFAPHSHVELRHGVDLHPLIGQRLPFYVTQYAKRGRDIVLSRKSMLEAEAKTNREEALKKLMVGSDVVGTVRSVVPFGAFIDVGGVEGLVPLAEMSHNRGDSPGDVFHVGQEVEVQIQRIDSKGKIWLSRKAVLPDPWAEVAKKYAEGSRHKGRVARLQPFGAFVELEPGIDGLIHTSDLSAQGKRVENPSEVLKQGDEIEVFVSSLDVYGHKIGLHPVPPEWPEGQPFTRVAVHKAVKVVVTGHDPNGLFVRIVGATGRASRGFITAAGTGTPRGTDLRKAFSVGSQHDAKVVEMDPRRNEVKLSIKALAEDSERTAYKTYKQQVKAEAKFGTLGDLLKKSQERK